MKSKLPIASLQMFYPKLMLADCDIWFVLLSALFYEDCSAAADTASSAVPAEPLSSPQPAGNQVKD